ncbi:FecR family protein [Niabella aurantiaca]|uniref:FecR family protein n=1 Tax=Niabella aurantiaca TaxID=379900 RepID=UPI00037811F6|nr:FecR family protein [Niabella aurantiaca]
MEWLLQKYLDNKCTPEEAEQVLAWLSGREYRPEQSDMIKQVIAASEASDDEHYSRHKEQLEAILEKIVQEIEKGKTSASGKREKRSMRWLAAAVMAGAFIVGGYFFIRAIKTGGKDPQVVQQPLAKYDLAPGGNKAILMLQDGSEVMLEDARNGDLAQQGGAVVVKKDGQLIYNKSGANAGTVFYNTITTPKGGQYQLILADGSRVWLNAGSSIRFPTAFTGNERKVEITGEAYFEVAKDPARPFRVAFETPSGQKSQVEVLGTHFNIMSYADERAAKTTLLEGCVKISSGSSMAVLKPAQQASQSGSEINVRSGVDVDEAIAWKNGYFQFDGASLQQVMQQIARWYDVEVSYEGTIPDRKFGGKISRDIHASEVLKILEASQVKFRIENRKIIVMP